MFLLDDDKTIYITRGDIARFMLKAARDGEAYTFAAGDVVRFKVCEKKACENVVLQKTFGVTESAESVEIFLDKQDTKIGDVISKPVDYWYEIELNPFTDPQTIIGYDDDGAKVFKLLPEGGDSAEELPDEEDIPYVDAELSLTSERPIQNQAVARAITEINTLIGEIEKNVSDNSDSIKELQEDPGDASAEDLIRAHNAATDAHDGVLAKAPKTYTAAVNTSWTSDSANGGYYNTVAVSGMLATDDPLADVVLGTDIDANALYLEAWALVTRITTGANTVTLWANGDAPTSAFTVQLKVVR